MTDQGQKPFDVEDEYNDCPKWVDEVKCKSDLTRKHMECLKSCNIYTLRMNGIFPKRLVHQSRIDGNKMV